MKISMNDLVSYIARDLRLHIWTVVGILFLGAVLLIVLNEYRKKRIVLRGTEKALDGAIKQHSQAYDECQKWRKIFGPFPALYENSPEAESGHNNNDRTIAIDLDGVILEYVDPWTGIAHFGDPLPGAAEAMGKLKSLGYKVVVYTTRNNSMAHHNRWHNALELTALVQAKLEDSKIPYDYISLFKPLARYYIDDRAIRFNSWGQTLEEIRRLEFARSIQRIEKMDEALGYSGDVKVGQYDPLQ
jgi:hypothetical protein